MITAALLKIEAREDGQTMAEYGVVLGMITFTIVLTVAALGDAFIKRLESVIHLIGSSVA
jgi:Flp pilus assembly pilin Flp